MAEHRIIYDEISLRIVGNFEEPEDETGFKGGFSSEEIYVTDQLGSEMNIYSWLNNGAIQEINRIVVEENY